MLRVLIPMLLLSLAGLAAGAPLSGQPNVLAGDLIEIGGQPIRLYGIDAPELDQTCKTRRGTVHACGKIARQVLRELIAGQPVTCTGETRDARGLRLAVCTIGRTDLGEQMVLQGWALADPKHGADYARAEKAARHLREGLWKRKFIPPWEWRENRRAEAPAAPAAPPFVIEFDGTPGTTFSGQCNLKTKSGTRPLNFDGTVPLRERYDGIGLSCRFKKTGKRGTLTIVVRKGGSIRSRSTTSGTGGKIVISVQ